jgi:hypothetical protein
MIALYHEAVDSQIGNGDLTDGKDIDIDEGGKSFSTSPLQAGAAHGIIKLISG